jgi:protein-L-isoaspartate(D-aspartate) O-methyltransferase
MLCSCLEARGDDTMTTSPARLRDEMVDRVVAGGWARSSRVAEAMRIVPRHQFVPAVPIDEAYAEQAVITKRGNDGAALSCASVPGIVAMMLDQLDVHVGHRVLEIGAGTGYNAALLAHLTGPAGHVTTVDIDPEVTARARQALDATVWRHVQVVTRDGALGDADHGPYDRIIVTVGAWDLAPAWWEQLVPGGRVVVPLRWRGQTRAIAFVRDGGCLRSDSVELCGFVPMIGQDGERTGRIDTDGQVALYWDADQLIDTANLRGVLDQPERVAWSAVTVGAEEPFDGIWLRLTAKEPGTCRIAADRAAVQAGVCAPAIPIRSPAIVYGNSLVYLTLRRRAEGDVPRFELGAIGHGTSCADLADRMCEQIHQWDRDRAVRPVITAHPTKTPDDQVHGERTIRKRNWWLVVAY